MAAAKATWGRYDQDVVLLPMCGDGDLRGAAVDTERRPVTVAYRADRGLEFKTG